MKFAYCSKGNTPEATPLIRSRACAGADVEYYRVVIDEDGEIRNATRLTNQASAIETAENWYYLVAGIGLTVTLLAVLESGQIIKCGARKVT